MRPMTVLPFFVAVFRAASLADNISFAVPINFFVIIADKGSEAQVGYSDDGGKSRNICCTTSNRALCGHDTKPGGIIVHSPTDGLNGAPYAGSFSILNGSATGFVSRRVSTEGSW